MGVKSTCILELVFQRLFGMGRPMNAGDFPELFSGIYGVQNMHLFKLTRSETFSSVGELGSPNDFRTFSLNKTFFKTKHDL